MSQVQDNIDTETPAETRLPTCPRTNVTLRHPDKTPGSLGVLTELNLQSVCAVLVHVLVRISDWTGFFTQRVHSHIHTHIQIMTVCSVTIALKSCWRLYLNFMILIILFKSSRQLKPLMSGIFLISIQQLQCSYCNCNRNCKLYIFHTTVRNISCK